MINELIKFDENIKQGINGYVYQHLTFDEIYERYINLINLYEIGNNGYMFKNGPSSCWDKLTYNDENIETKLINHNILICIISQNISKNDNLEIIISKILEYIMNGFNELKHSEQNSYNKPADVINKHKFLYIIKQFISNEDYNKLINIFNKLF